MGKQYMLGVIEWMRQMSSQRQLVSPKDFDCISIFDTPDEVFKILFAHYKECMALKQEKRAQGMA